MVLWLELHIGDTLEPMRSNDRAVGFWLRILYFPFILWSGCFSCSSVHYIQDEVPALVIKQFIEGDYFAVDYDIDGDHLVDYRAYHLIKKKKGR